MKRKAFTSLSSFLLILLLILALSIMVNCVTTTTYDNCVQIKTMDQSATDGEYIIVIGGSQLTVTCLFRSKSWTLLHRTINTNKGNNGYENFSDNGIHYTKIWFKNRGNHYCDYVTGGGNRWNQNGFSGYMNGLKISGQYYFSDTCPNSGRSSVATCSGIGTQLLPQSSYTARTNNNVCYDGNDNSVGYCWNEFQLNMPTNTKLQGIVDVQTFKASSTSNNRMQYDYEFYGTYDVPTGQYCEFSSTNTKTCNGNYIMIMSI